MGPIWKLFLKTVFSLLEQKTNFQLQKHIWQNLDWKQFFENLFLKQNDFLEQNLGFLGAFCRVFQKNLEDRSRTFVLYISAQCLHGE